MSTAIHRLFVPAPRCEFAASLAAVAETASQAHFDSTASFHTDRFGDAK
jgi:hypothetical protein